MDEVTHFKARGAARKAANETDIARQILGRTMLGSLDEDQVRDVGACIVAAHRHLDYMARVIARKESDVKHRQSNV